MKILFAITVAAGALLVSTHDARADEIRVLAAGAAKIALQRIAPEFERSTGHRVIATYDTVGAQRDRVMKAEPGAAADVVILSNAALVQLEASGRLIAHARTPIGSVVVALAVPEAASPPDISSPEKLRAALLATSNIAYADPARGATAGTHFNKVVDALGVREAIQGRITMLPFGGDVIEGVAHGRFALGVSQSSEILQHAGVRMAGGLPAPYALTTPYAAALTRDTAAARALLDAIGSTAARVEWRATGFLDAP